MPGSPSRDVTPGPAKFAGPGYPKQGKMPEHLKPTVPGPGKSTTGHGTGQGKPGTEKGFNSSKY